MKALYIHGLHSNGKSNTFRILKKVLNNYDWISETFDLLNPDETFAAINSIIVNEDVQLVVGSSFGGFYCMYSKDGPKKIVINPCMSPIKEIPPLLDEDEELTPEAKDAIKKAIYGHIAGLEETNMIYGIFGEDDELFHYKDKFDTEWHSEHAGEDNSCLVPGHHRMTLKELEEPLEKAMTWLSGDIDRIKNSLSTHAGRVMIDNPYAALEESKIELFETILNESGILRESFVHYYPMHKSRKMADANGVELEDIVGTFANREGMGKNIFDKYGKECFDLIFAGYKSIGGIGGNPSTTLDMVESDSDFWKIKVGPVPKTVKKPGATKITDYETVVDENGKLIPLFEKDENGNIVYDEDHVQLVAIYGLDRGGRKLQIVTSAPGCVDKLKVFAKAEFNSPGYKGAKSRNSWAEVSDAIENIYVKYGEAPIIPFTYVENDLLANKALKKYGTDSYNDADSRLAPSRNYEKGDERDRQHYIRQIGPNKHEKQYYNDDGILVNDETSPEIPGTNLHRKIVVGHHPRVPDSELL